MSERREWWLVFDHHGNLMAANTSGPETIPTGCIEIHVREVLPGDPNLDDPLVANLSIADIIQAVKERDKLAAKLAEAKAERDRLRKFVSDSGTTCYSCEKCGHARNGRGCLWCERDEARQQLAAAESERDRLRDLVSHCWVHSAYKDCGYQQMTTEQKELYDRVKAIDPAQPEPEITEQDKTWEQFCDEVKEDLGLYKVFGPDPGEGWELCGMNEGEQFRWQWDSDQLWYDGKNSGAKYHRRRKVMTEPPSREAVPDDRECWVVTSSADRGLTHEVHRGRDVRKWWKGNDYPCEPVAWCHRLDGETEPPKILVDYREGE